MEALAITICIVLKGFRGFRKVSPASILIGGQIGLSSTITYALYAKRWVQLTY